MNPPTRPDQLKHPIDCRALGIAPVVHDYYWNAGGQGWNAPAGTAGTTLATGPMKFIGVWDTRPELAAWDADFHKSLSAKPSPGGVTLRWSAGRQSDLAFASFIHPAPAFMRGAALVLYVAGVDVPPVGKWRGEDRWPGAWPSSQAWDFNTSWIDSLVSSAAGVRGGVDWSSVDDGIRFLARNNARPVLDLMSYVGGPWSEADLSELAGGTRYVAAWVRAMWSRHGGVDHLASVDYHLPLVTMPGRARAACHRVAWHCAYALESAPTADPGDDVYNDGVRLGLASPIAGIWRVSGVHNGAAGRAPLTVGVELRGSCALERYDFELTVGGEREGIETEQAHGGAAVLTLAHDTSPGEQGGALLHVEVVAGGNPAASGLGGGEVTP